MKKTLFRVVLMILVIMVLITGNSAYATPVPQPKIATGTLSLDSRVGKKVDSPKIVESRKNLQKPQSVQTPSERTSGPGKNTGTNSKISASSVHKMGSTPVLTKKSLPKPISELEKKHVPSAKPENKLVKKPVGQKLPLPAVVQGVRRNASGTSILASATKKLALPKKVAAASSKVPHKPSVVVASQTKSIGKASTAQAPKAKAPSVAVQSPKPTVKKGVPASSTVPPAKKSPTIASGTAVITKTIKKTEGKKVFPSIIASAAKIVAVFPVTATGTPTPLPVLEKKGLYYPPSVEPASLPKSIMEDAFPEEKASRPEEESKLNISGTKTFEMKKADVKGDVGHFSTENFDSIPGFHLDQSLHLEIDGNISRSTTVKAILDDKDDEERRFTVHIDGRVWKWTIGDFPLSIKDTEFALHNKEVRGVALEGALTENWKTMFLYSGSKGMARREQFRGSGQQQEFRLTGKPVVQNSERVFIDGKLLIKGTDYLVDYEEGIIKFQPKLLPIEVTSWIIVEYEVSDAKMAFKRTLMGVRSIYDFADKGRLGVTVLREADDTTPKTESVASGPAGAVRPMEHQIVDFDGVWKLSQNFSLQGEKSFSIFDPNSKSDVSVQDKKLSDSASRLTLLGKTERLAAEVSRRQIGKGFKLIGREGGVMELGERGLVSDLLKENGRVTYTLTPEWSLFGGMEKSKTNQSGDPAFSAISFSDLQGGALWKYRPKSQFEGRYETQEDRETLIKTISDRDKKIGTLVWDHDFGRLFAQSKVENTEYADSVNTSSGSKILNSVLSLGSDVNKKLTWNVSAGAVTLDDDLDKNKIRSQIKNYMIDMTFDPNRVFNARGIFQWRRETDYLVNMNQNDEIADSRIQYRPNPDLRTQFKYKVENTTKIVRDPSLDPQKFIRPPSLPLTNQEKEDLVGTYQNPVQKRTSNFSTNYRLGENGETNFDWKFRDLKDRLTGQILSFNDRRSYEFRYNPVKKWRFTSEYEDGVARNLTPKNELRDIARRVGLSNEFRPGYIVETRYDDHDENDVYSTDNDRRTISKILNFQRIFSERAAFECGLQRNTIDFRQPSKEWEKRAALTITPRAKNQRYRFFLSHKDIEAEKSGNHVEGGVNFSQFIGTDSIIDGEIKKVKSSAGINGQGYDGTVANAKMVITF